MSNREQTLHVGPFGIGLDNDNKSINASIMVDLRHIRIANHFDLHAGHAQLAVESARSAVTRSDQLDTQSSGLM